MAGREPGEPLQARLPAGARPPQPRLHRLHPAHRRHPAHQRAAGALGNSRLHRQGRPPLPRPHAGRHRRPHGGHAQTLLRQPQAHHSGLTTAPACVSGPRMEGRTVLPRWTTWSTWTNWRASTGTAPSAWATSSATPASPSPSSSAPPPPTSSASWARGPGPAPATPSSPPSSLPSPSSSLPLTLPAPSQDRVRVPLAKKGRRIDKGVGLANVLSSRFLLK